MEKVCEYCLAFRPVIYCKADSALLCLSCDSKVHSANALSSRHPRTLICESCKHRLAYARCYEHQMFTCRVCDRNLHQDSSQHQKKFIGFFMGCPSAKYFATLWDLDLNEWEENGIVEDQFVSNSCVSDDPGVMKPIGGFRERSKSMCAESEVGSSSQQSEETTSSILQQILHLKRLQLKKGNDKMSLICGQDQTGISSSKCDAAWNFNKILDQHSQKSHGVHSDLQQMDSSCEELNIELFPLSFSQLEHSTSSLTVGNPLQGEDIWQCKSSFQNSELWSQNMQDLGVCEELSCIDDLNIPDVDLTFRNFEEIFGGDQYPSRVIPDERELTCFPKEKVASKEDPLMVSSSVFTSEPSGTCLHSLSFSHSRLGAESSGTTRLEDEGNSTMRYKGKKKTRRYEKQIRSTSKKSKAADDWKHRVKGHFLKGSDNAADVTRSY